MRQMPPTRPLPAILLHAAALAVLALLAFGMSACGTHASPGPPLSGEAGVLGVAISRGTLMPGYSQAVKSYAVHIPAAPESIDVTATLVDPRAKLWINGGAAQSGIPFRVGLSGPQTSVDISTLAEDGAGRDLVQLAITVTEPNVRVWVLDSVGGTYPKGARLTLADSSGRVLEPDMDFPAAKNGSLALGLDPRGRYSIYARADGTARACFADFDPSKEDTATLYCLPNWAAAFPAEAPIITEISFSGQPGSGYEELPPGTNSLAAPLSNVQYVKVTAVARCAITEADWGPVPINVALDSLAWLGSGAYGVADEKAREVGMDGQIYFQSTYRFQVPHLQNLVANRDHWLDIVVYDIANNRTERRVYLTITDSAASSAADADLTLTAPTTVAAQGQTYGITQNYPAINPIDSYGAHYSTLLAFRLSDATETFAYDRYSPVPPMDQIDPALSNLPGIRGFEVWRSNSDNANFNKIDTVSYTGINKGLAVVDDDGYGRVTVGQSFYYRDQTPDVVEDVMFYRFIAFNGNPAGGGRSAPTDAISVTPLPPFTTRLTAPAHGASVSGRWPTMKFQVTNPALCGQWTGGQFYYTIFAKVAQAEDAAFSITIEADFEDFDPRGGPAFYYISDWPRKYPATDDNLKTGRRFAYLDADGSFVLDMDTMRLNYWAYAASFNGFLPYFTYEWTVLGMNYGIIGGGLLQDVPTNAAFFNKNYLAPDGKESSAYSFGSTSLYGLGSPNGFFLMTILPEG